MPLVLYSALIAIVSSIPTLAPPGGGPISDKIWHVGEYAGWALLFRRALDRGRSVTTRRPLKIGITLVAGALLAVADENFQRTVGRHYAVSDMLADVTGVLLSVPVYEWLSARVRLARRKAIDHSPGAAREASKS